MDRRSRSDGLGAFSLHYKASTVVARAAGDIERIESLLEGGQSFSVELAPQGGGDGAAAPVSELRMFEVGESLRLSDIMPMLSNFGITVISEEADELRIDSGGAAVHAFVQSFRVQDAHGAALESMSGAPMLAEALTAVRSGQTEDGPLNALALDAGLGWREIALLRTYRGGGLPDAPGAGAPGAAPRAVGQPEARADAGRDVPAADGSRGRRQRRPALRRIALGLPGSARRGRQHRRR